MNYFIIVDFILASIKAYKFSGALRCATGPPLAVPCAPSSAPRGPSSALRAPSSALRAPVSAKPARFTRHQGPPRKNILATALLFAGTLIIIYHSVFIIHFVTQLNEQGKTIGYCSKQFRRTTSSLGSNLC